jgi:DNA ligase 1
MTFKPLLAATLTSSCDDNIIYAAMQKLRYPVIVTEKVDGIRALKQNGILVSRTLKPIPSRHLQFASQFLPEGMDMELWSPDYTFQQIMSGVMSEEGSPNVLGLKFVPLDIFLDMSYKFRLQLVDNFCNQSLDCVLPMYHCVCNNADELMQEYTLAVTQNKEGICFRLPNSPYPQKKGENRSTLKEQYLVKLACAKIGDAKIVGFEEKMINLAPATITAFGTSQRKTGRELPANTLGAIVVEDLVSGIKFNIGTGFDDNSRKEIWTNRSKWLGAIVSYQAKTVGTKEKPRCPSFRGRRYDI